MKVSCKSKGCNSGLDVRYCTLATVNFKCEKCGAEYRMYLDIEEHLNLTDVLQKLTKCNAINLYVTKSRTDIVTPQIGRL